MGTNLLQAFKQVVKRSLSYVTKGYAVASLPLVFLGYASSIYYLAVENTAFLHSVFPSFTSFLIVAALTLPIACGLIGYAYYKRSILFKEELLINAESNPIQAHVQHQTIVVLIKMMERLGVEVPEEYLRLKRYWERIDNKRNWRP